MAAADLSGIQVSVHLDQHSSVSFDAANLWPDDEAESDTASVAGEVARRLTDQGFVGFNSGTGSITFIPASAVKRVDVSALPNRADSG
jgi:hypothetical protein